MTAFEDLLGCLDLKALPRTGWVRRGVHAPESVAAHSWGVGLLVLALLPDDLDAHRALAYATLHDLPEALVGDITPHDGVSKADKAAREAEAMAQLCARLPHLEALWHAYEAQEDAEARFVRQLDRLDMALQAVVYAREGVDGMSEFVASAARVVSHPRLVPLLEEAAKAVRDADSAR
jgi:putative hydrolase of HD superfamily